MKITAYLNYGGNCAEAFQYYEKHLGGKVQGVMKWSQMPDAAKHTPPGFENAVLHGRIVIGETAIMASDVPGYQPDAERVPCAISGQQRGGGASLCGAC